MTLSSKIKQELKAKAHALKPVILVGNQGVTEAVKKEIDRALYDHELIKIRIASNDRDARRELFATICTDLNADMVQQIGNVGVVFRKSTK